RRSGQKACLEVLSRLTLLIAPILPHTAEEVYARNPVHKLGSVFFDSLSSDPAKLDNSLHQKVEKLLDVRSWVFAEFELWKPASEVKDSQDVEASLTVTEDEA